MNLQIMQLSTLSCTYSISRSLAIVLDVNLAIDKVVGRHTDDRVVVSNVNEQAWKEELGIFSIFPTRCSRSYSIANFQAEAIVKELPGNLLPSPLHTT